MVILIILQDLPIYLGKHRDNSSALQLGCISLPKLQTYGRYVTFFLDDFHHLPIVKKCSDQEPAKLEGDYAFTPIVRR